MTISSKKSGIKVLYYTVSTIWIIAIIGTIIPLADLIGAVFNSTDNTLDYLPVEASVNQLSLPNTAQLSDFEVNSVKAIVSLPVAKRTILFYDHGLELVRFLIVVAVFYFARQIVGSLQTGSPFTLANARRVRALTILILVGMIFKLFAYYSLSILIADQLLSLGLSLDISSAHNSALLIMTIVLAILGEAFRYGVRMQEEQTLTV